MRPLLAAFLVVALAGCGVEVLTTTAIQGELQAEQLKSMKRQVEGVSESTGKINIQRAIDTYYAEKGYYPLTLDSLVPDYLPSLPKRPDGTAYAYDRNTGRLLDGPADASMAAGGQGGSDAERMAQIRAAIDRYGQATGYYPPSLQALTPQYLAAVPKAGSGQDFIYDPRDGGLYVPGPAPAQPVGQNAARSRAAGVGGAGPMGEVMTGIGMQQELNRMGSSGANSAGSYGRRAIGAHTEQHQQQQEQALRELEP